MTNRQPTILSRMFDADGTPRDRAMWLVFAGVVASQLLAFFVVCDHQVRRAETRHSQLQVSAAQGCSTRATVPAALRCGSQTADASATPMGSQLR
jgi:hypothetical protein